jgi:hypothetical protein
MEAVGEVFVNFLGLNQSKFQWIIDQKEREDEAAERRRIRALKQQDAAMSHLEAGETK